MKSPIDHSSLSNILYAFFLNISYIPVGQRKRSQRKRNGFGKQRHFRYRQVQNYRHTNAANQNCFHTENDELHDAN